MPVVVPHNLPAIDILQSENIFVMDNDRADHQDIRPLRIIILNIMPTKISTEVHLLRRLSNTPLQVEVDLMQMKEHESKNTPKEHLEYFYKTFDQISHRKYDGMIVTGAPVELLDFEDVDYWEELKKVLDWSTTHVTSSFFICWAAQAALYHFYGIKKRELPQKLFGVFPHRVLSPNCPLLRGFDDEFWAPHSRHTDVLCVDIEREAKLELLAKSDEAGAYLTISRNGKQIFVTGHSEYDTFTLKEEYERDLLKGLPIQVPKNYFPDDDPRQAPVVRWKAHGNLLFLNWLNYFVYQETPYEWE
jgi:homoserine O-succinyltransferase/O-acetyltransferase